VIAQKRVVWLFLVPSVALLAVIVIFPMVYSFGLSFFSWPVARPDRGIHFVGLQNYLKLILGDTDFHHSLRLTLIFTGSVTAIEFFLGFGLAYLFYRQGGAEKVFTSMFMIPPMLAPVIIALQWRLLFDLQYGLINWLLGSIGVINQPIGWLTKKPYALYSIIIVDVWHWTPLVYLILLAGFQSLPRDPFEAAIIDGASGWQLLSYLYVPLLKPVIMIALLIRSVTAFIFFEEILILTGGGPGNSTEVLAWFLYKIGFRFWDMGYAAAGTWLFLAMVIVFYEVFVWVMAKEI